MSAFTDILKTIAPTIASALLGPLGGVAVSALGSIIGIDAPTQDRIGKAFKEQQLTGEQILQIKALELQYQNEEKERGFKYSELEFKDTESARNMQMTTNSTTPTVLSYAITIGFFGILGYMMTDVYKSSEPLLVMLGSLGTAWISVVGFWFGSSHGSAQKSELLAAQSK